MALCTYPALMSSNEFPQDVKDKAQKWLNACAGGSVGKLTRLNTGPFFWMRLRLIFFNNSNLNQTYSISF